MSTDDNDMDTNTVLRTCFRTRFPHDNASEFDNRVRLEMMKISHDETVGSLRNLCAELVTFDTMKDVQSMQKRIDKMCRTALGVFEVLNAKFLSVETHKNMRLIMPCTRQQSTAIDDAKREELRKQIKNIEDKSAKAWEHKIQSSRGKSDRRHKSKVAENDMREKLFDQQIAGKVRVRQK